MSLPTLNEIIETFSYLEDWSDRYGYLIELGNRLEPIAPDEYDDKHIVRGCASRVWMIFDHLPDQRLHIRADSDAHIVRGLISLVLALYSDHTPFEIMEISPNDIFDQLNLTQHLTPQRTNGLVAIIERIKVEAGRSIVDISKSRNND